MLFRSPSRKHYSVEHRAHCYKLNEESIRSIMSIFREKGFIIDPEILLWYEEINNIIQHPIEYVPSATIEDGQIKLVNCNKQAEEYFNNHKTGRKAEDLFLAKTMNLFFPGNLIEDIINNVTTCSMSKNLLAHSSHNVSVTDYSKEDTAAMINNLRSYPVLMLIDEKENILEEKKFNRNYAKYQEYMELDKKEKLHAEYIPKPRKTKFIVDNVTMEALFELQDRKSTRLNSSHIPLSRMPSSA